MKKLSVIFYLKGDKFRNGENAIYAKIKVGNAATTMSTGKYITKERLETTNRLMTAKKVDKEVSLKNYINNIEGEIERLYINLLKDDSILEVKPLHLCDVSKK